MIPACVVVFLRFFGLVRKATLVWPRLPHLQVRKPLDANEQSAAIINPWGIRKCFNLRGHH
jgi:hypothetical protein